MCNVIILFLLFCNGCGCSNNYSSSNNSCSGNSGSSCGSDNRRSMTSCGNDNSQGGDSVIQTRSADCGCDRDRDCGCDRDRDRDRDWDRDRDRDSSMTSPPWVRSNYSNGDTCSCTEQ